MRRDKRRYAAICIGAAFAASLCVFSERSSDDGDILARANYGDAIYTASGNLSYDAVDRLVYRDLGYSIVGKAYPFAQLALLARPTCKQVFADWNAIAAQFDPNTIPPKEIPSEKYDQYTMKNLSFLEYRYRNDKHNTRKKSAKSRRFNWNETLIEALLTQQPNTFVSYKAEGMGLHHALQYFKETLTGQKGVVIGSIDPWAEVLALLAGAAHVTTVEYQRITMGHPKMTYLHPIDQSKDYANELEKYDFAVSFSSIEHSGLGRYGDIIDPIGDIREVQKVWCELKPGGLFFLGLPVGRDSVIFNLHRIYGRVRLPLLFEGFELINVFHSDNATPELLSRAQMEIPHYSQPVLVLRKVMIDETLTTISSE